MLHRVNNSVETLLLFSCVLNEKVASALVRQMKLGLEIAELWKLCNTLPGAMPSAGTSAYVYLRFGVD